MRLRPTPLNIEMGRQTLERRLTFLDLPASVSEPSFCDSVARGLSLDQKTIPSRYFYDEAGSRLFEQITDLPEYYLTRTDESILERFAGEIVGQMANGFSMVEFGSGSSRKTRLLIEAAIERQGSLHYVPIDISSSFLRTSSKALLDAYPSLSVEAIGAEYHDAVRHLPPPLGPRLMLFLGSNIGNFARSEAVDFLRALAHHMTPEDRLFIGIDLKKDRTIIEPAYNDGQGITARFNLNLLVRINRELDGRFDLGTFEHRAPFLEEESRVEMRLVSLMEQTVEVEGIGQTFQFRQGEYIHTENSYKYTHAQFAQIAASAGLEVEQTWMDERQWFAEKLLRTRR